MILNARELRAHSGEFFEHWRRQCLAALGVLGELELEPHPLEEDHDVEPD
jgi:hypothetical protein